MEIRRLLRLHDVNFGMSYEVFLVLILIVFLDAPRCS